MDQLSFAEIQRLLGVATRSAEKLSAEAQAARTAAEAIQYTVERISSLVNRLAEEEERNRLSR